MSESQEAKEIQPAQENVTSISQSKKQKFSKIDMKRAQQQMDRRKRLINDGVAEDKVDAVMAKEDYEAQPVEKKVKRLESVVNNIFTGMSHDMMNLRRNDGAIAEAFDINYRAIVKMFARLGITPEQHKEVMDEVQADLAAERQQREKASVEAELTNNKPTEAAGSDAPDGATQFGG